MNGAPFALKATVCAICGCSAHDRELYSANFKSQDLAPEIFSARRMPDSVHYRIVECRQCGLIRSNPVLDEDVIAGLYASSHFTYPLEAAYAARTYGTYFKRYAGDVSKDGSILEIGCGNGTFLQWLMDQGYSSVRGIEPSQEAVAAAGTRKPLIHNGFFSRGIYPPASFDCLCAFQVFDHMYQPDEFLEQAKHYLKKGGKLFMVMHNIGALPARVLGRACPMIDIEHPFLYNKKTLKKIMERHGFKDMRLFSVSNRYPLKYWLALMPLSLGLKKKAMDFLTNHPIGTMPVTLGLGNMGIVASMQ